MSSDNQFLMDFGKYDWVTDENAADIIDLRSAKFKKSSASFFETYNEIRLSDGWVLNEQDWHTAPKVAKNNPKHELWLIRARSFAKLVENLRFYYPVSATMRPIVFDVGSGNCWLSHKLAKIGYQVVAIDGNTSEADGLGSVPLKVPNFLRVAANIEKPPFRKPAPNIVIFNASLHYLKSPLITLQDYLEILAPGSTIYILDCPVFSRERDAHIMVEEQRNRIREYMDDLPENPGRGYLLYDEFEVLSSPKRSVIVKFLNTSENRLADVINRTIFKLKRKRMPADIPLISIRKN